MFVVCCVLQCQQQKAAGEDEKNGEDFAEDGCEVVHGVLWLFDDHAHAAMPIKHRAGLAFVCRE